MQDVARPELSRKPDDGAAAAPTEGRTHGDGSGPIDVRGLLVAAAIGACVSSAIQPRGGGYDGRSVVCARDGGWCRTDAAVRDVLRVAERRLAEGRVRAGTPPAAERAQAAAVDGGRAGGDPATDSGYRQRGMGSSVRSDTAEAPSTVDDWISAIWVADASPMYVPGRGVDAEFGAVPRSACASTRQGVRVDDMEGAVADEFYIRALICSPEFSWDCGWAMSTVWCESRFDPNAQGAEWYQGRLWHFNGLWQIAEGPFDPYLNTVEAHIQYVQWQRGLRARPWPNCP